MKWDVLMGLVAGVLAIIAGLSLGLIFRAVMGW